MTSLMDRGSKRIHSAVLHACENLKIISYVRLTNFIKGNCILFDRRIGLIKNAFEKLQIHSERVFCKCYLSV